MRLLLLLLQMTGCTSSCRPWQRAQHAQRVQRSPEHGARQLRVAVGAVVPAALHAWDRTRGHPLQWKQWQAVHVCWL